MKLVKKAKRGFTIVELVIVIGVIGILSAILIPTFVNLNASAEGARAKQEVSDAYSLYLQDATDNEGPALAQYGQNGVVIQRGTALYKYDATNGWVAALEAEKGDIVGVANAYNNCTVYAKASA